MATQKQLEDAFKALIPILKQIEMFEEEYGAIIREYKDKTQMTAEERNDAAIEMLNKYSKI